VGERWLQPERKFRGEVGDVLSAGKNPQQVRRFAALEIEIDTNQFGLVLAEPLKVLIIRGVPRMVGMIIGEQIS